MEVRDQPQKEAEGKLEGQKNRHTDKVHRDARQNSQSDDHVLESSRASQLHDFSI